MDLKNIPNKLEDMMMRVGGTKKKRYESKELNGNSISQDSWGCK